MKSIQRLLVPPIKYSQLMFLLVKSESREREKETKRERGDEEEEEEKKEEEEMTWQKSTVLVELGPPYVEG